MQIEKTVQILAPPTRIWTILQDVEKWPQWTESMKQLELLDAPALQMGSRVRNSQPRLPAIVWSVTQCEPNHGFVWEARSWGALAVAEHWIRPLSEDSTMVILKLSQTGWLGSLVASLMRATTHRYMEMEAQGLKRRT